MVTTSQVKGREGEGAAPSSDKCHISMLYHGDPQTETIAKEAKSNTAVPKLTVIKTD
jgi:hypothetical protein